MVDRKYGTAQAASQRQLLDSLRNVVIANPESFGEIADRYSIDPSVKRNHGDLGWISAGRFPYSFETKAYETAIGEVSEVFETPFGYHILTVTGKRENPGEVLVQHILKLTQGLPQNLQDEKKAEIDSIAALLATGADFDKIAQEESEDPGTAKNGGRLPWFGTGRMVPQFESTSFTLKDGETSAPFRTDYGWHIVRKIESRGIAPLEELRQSIEGYIKRDERNNIPKEAKETAVRAKYNVTVDTKVIDGIKSQILAAGAIDSTLLANLKSDETIVITLDKPGTNLSVAEVFAMLPDHITNLGVDEAYTAIDERVDAAAGEAAMDTERESLITENVEYRNLLNEYRDGMLLFEISDRNVWNKAKEDVEGLNKFFEKNKSKYTDWTAPKFKGMVIFTTNDSIADAAKKYLEENQIVRREVAAVLAEQFGRKNVKVERVIAAKGENPIIDYLAFEGEATKPNGKWQSCFTYLGEIIDQPQEADDVKGKVTTDYQNHLEKEWVKQLRKKYKVKVNKKILREVEAQQPMPISE